jgi:anti-sigma B factor antagonist
MDLGLDTTEHGGVCVLEVRGEVDVSTAPRFRQALMELAGEGQATVVVDLDGVEFLDSTGLGVLVSGLKRFRTMGGDLILVCNRPRILDVLKLTRLDQAFAVHPNVAAATGVLG